MNVFIAEDEPIVLMGFRRIVEANGYRVIGTASSGKEAVARILALRPDVVLMDINLPELDGISAIERIHQAYQVPAVLITGYRNPALLGRMKNAGVFGYLQKPVDEYEIISTLQIARDRHHELRNMQQERDEAITRLDERKTVERAKSILMEHFALKDSDAMKLLQKKSRDSNRKLVQVAREILKKAQLLE